MARCHAGLLSRTEELAPVRKGPKGIPSEREPERKGAQGPENQTCENIEAAKYSQSLLCVRSVSSPCFSDSEIQVTS